MLLANLDSNVLAPRVLQYSPSLHCMQELFGGYDGVKLLIDYLKRDIDKFASGLGHHRLLLAAVDCVWCTVVGNAVVEDMFLEQEGMLVLLDILNVSTLYIPLCPG